MTEIQCENCGQPALATDVNCWQCGRPLPGGGALAETAAASPPADERQAAMLGVYGATTAVIILLTLALLTALGREPALQAGSWQVPEGLLPRTDVAETFALYLPEEWTALDAGDARQRPRFNALWSEQRALRTVLAPWLAAFEDVAVLFLAAPELAEGSVVAPSTLLLVARSRDLAGLRPAQIVTRAQRLGDPRQAAVVENYNKSHAYLEQGAPLLGADVICEQQLHPSQTGGLILVFCAPEFHPIRQRLPVIRESFQSFIP